MKKQTNLNELSMTKFDVLSAEEAKQILGGHGCRRRMKVRMPKCKKRRYGNCHSTKSSSSSSSCVTPPPPPTPIVP